MQFDETSTVSTVVQGGVSATAVAFLNEALIHMIPYAFCAVPLIVLDLYWGIKAARHRKEKVTFSRGFRKTMGKIMEYCCWIILASTLALAFRKPWLEWFILASVMGNELISILGNYLETKGLKLSLKNVWALILRFFGKKIGMELSKEDTDSVLIEVKRDKNGRFVNK